MAYSGEGKLIEAVDPFGTTIPLVCDANGELLVDATISGTIPPITGTVSVSNFPTNQDVTVTNFPSTTTVVQPTGSALHVDVDNFPVTQPISGTVAVSNFPSVQTVAVDNFPVTQPVSGTVAVANFPSSYPITGNVGIIGGVSVTGTVVVSNFPTSQNVIDTNVGLSYGSWAYFTGVSGSVTVNPGDRLIAITAYSTVGGSIAVNGGPNIIIPPNTAFSIEPLGNLVGSSVVFTGTDSYFIEVVS